MKDNNDKNTIDFIENDNDEVQTQFMSYYLSFLMQVRNLNKKELDILIEILLASKNQNNLIVNVKDIAKSLNMPVNNIYRHITNLVKNKIIIKNDNNYELSVENYTLKKLERKSKEDD